MNSVHVRPVFIVLDLRPTYFKDLPATRWLVSPQTRPLGTALAFNFTDTVGSAVYIFIIQLLLYYYFSCSPRYTGSLRNLSINLCRKWNGCLERPYSLFSLVSESVPAR